MIEEIAYRDTWGKGADSFIAMIYERLKLMHDLLAENGSIYVHCDYRVSVFMKLVLMRVLVQRKYQNEIIGITPMEVGDQGHGLTESTIQFIGMRKIMKTIFIMVKKRVMSEILTRVHLRLF